MDLFISRYLKEFCFIYRFVIVDVGGYGCENDAGVFAATSFGEALLQGNLDALDFPSPRSLPGTNDVIPYFLGADDAFPLKPEIMKPFAGRGLHEFYEIFNYRCV